ncbi:MAG: TRAP transporter large permease subunit, partial [Rhodospirillales bacterium]|nr:TRAP transporter large permease subunit [Rhodospirillales bacterium]
MDVGTITVLMVVALLALMLTGMPLGITTLVVSIGITLIHFGEPGLFLVASNVLDVLHKYPLVAVPLFVLMASILERSGVAEDLFNAMAIISGNIRGGVAVQTTLVSVIMAAMTGVIGGEIVMLGLIALPQMLRLGYDRKLAMGSICASGILATLIPPSIVMIVYGFSAGISITDLFLAGVTPGLLYASMFILYILIRCNLQPHLAPLAPEELQVLNGVEKVKLLRGLILPALLITWVMGSIYGGIASVTEAAGVGVFGAIFTAWARRHLSWSMILDAVERTMYTMGRIIWLILGAVSLIGIYNVIGGNTFMKTVLTGLDLPPIGIIIVMMLILMLLGTFLEWIAIVFITVPIFAPVVVDLGFDPVWFGVLFVMNMQIYFLSPPFGPAAFWLKSVAPEDVQLQEIFLGVLPFIGLQIIGMFLVLFIPEIAMWLPHMV